jgi:site-specific DNA recombinase
VRGIVNQGAYGGTHVIRAQGGPVERAVPAIVEPDLQEKALARLEENRRYSGGRKGRNYLLRGLVKCAHCGTACTGDVSVSSMGYRYHYYSCRKKRVTSDKRTRGLSCPKVKAEWLEDLVWADVRGFLEKPGEVLQRVREQLADDPEAEGLEERHASLTRRLASKRGEKDRYVKLYAQGLVDDEELEGHLADLKNQVENLKMLVAAVEVDLAAKDERALVARTTEAWLLTLRENLADVEQDTEGAFGARRELATLLVEGITVSRGGDGRPRVEITYRFGPPEPGPGQAARESALGVEDSEEFARAHARGGTQGLLRGHPKMTSYEVAVQRAGLGGE